MYGDTENLGKRRQDVYRRLRLCQIDVARIDAECALRGLFVSAANRLN
jgi:hypothetical protein